MAKVLFSLTWPEGEPTPEAVCERYGFRPDELDEQFGVVEIDPEDNLYSVLVDAEAARRVAPRGWKDEDGLEGPFSNPRIEPFGPPEPE